MWGYNLCLLPLVDSVEETRFYFVFILYLLIMLYKVITTADGERMGRANLDSLSLKIAFSSKR